MVLRSLYQPELQEIADLWDIQVPPDMNPVVAPDADWIHAVQHTLRYIGGDYDQWPHYRYNRYAELLEMVAKGPEAYVLVDIGCGAGLFTWAFLDWASLRQVEYSRVALYGWDHCQAMLDLASEMRSRLIDQVPDYPELVCHTNPDQLQAELSRNHRPGFSYTITLGHVLIQAGEDAITHFANLVSQIAELPEVVDPLNLVAVDARTSSSILEERWSLLLSDLEARGMEVIESVVRKTVRNGPRSAKFATVSALAELEL